MLGPERGAGAMSGSGSGPSNGENSQAGRSKGHLDVGATHGAVPAQEGASFLSLRDLSPSPQSGNTNFVQQQKAAIERLQAQNGDATDVGPSTGASSRINSRGLRLGKQLGKARTDSTADIVHTPASVSMKASEFRAKARAGSAQPDFQSRTEASSQSHLPPDLHLMSEPTLNRGPDTGIMMLAKSIETTADSRPRSSTLVESGESSGSSQAADPSSSSSDVSDPGSGVSVSSALAAARPAPMNAISSATMRKPFRLSGMHYIRDDTPSLTSGNNEMREGLTHWDPASIASPRAASTDVNSLSRAPRRHSRSDLLPQQISRDAGSRQPALGDTSVNAAERSASTDGGFSAANMWERKRASADNLLDGVPVSAGHHASIRDMTSGKRSDATTSSGVSGSSTERIHPQDDADDRAKRRSAQRELVLPQLNGIRNGANNSTRIVPQGPSLATYNPNNNELPRSSNILNDSNRLEPVDSERQTLHVGIGKRTEATRESRASTSASSGAADLTPRPQQGAGSTFQDLYNRTPQPSNVAQDTRHQDERPDRHVGRAIQNEMPTSQDTPLSDRAIVQLGALPGMDPSDLLNANGQALSSKNILTIALQKAQSAVLLDSTNKVPEAMLAYRQAVRLLHEVMERVAPQSSSRSRRSHRDEERRRLKVIHDTYADRIRLLSVLDSSVPSTDSDTVPTSTDTKEDRRLIGATTGLGISGNTEEARDRGVRSSRHDTRLNPSIAISTADASDSRGDAGDVLGSSSTPRQLGPVGQQRHISRHHLDEATSGAHTPATPYFDFDQDHADAGSEETEDVVDPAAVTDAPRGRKLRGHDKDVDLPSMQSKRMLDPPTARKHLSKARSASSSPKSDSKTLSTSNASTASAQSKFNTAMARPVSTESDTSFYQLMSRAQAASSMLPATPSTSTSRGSVQPSPSFDLSSPPPASSTSRRRASTLVGRSVSPTDSKRQLVNSSTSTGTISQRRKQAAGAAPQANNQSDHTSADLARGLTQTTNGYMPGPKSTSPADDLTYQKSMEMTVLDKPHPLLVKDTDEIIAVSGKNEQAPESPSLSQGFRKRAISQPDSNRRLAIPPVFRPAEMPVLGHLAGTGLEHDALLSSFDKDALSAKGHILRKSSMPMTPQMHGFVAGSTNTKLSVSTVETDSPTDHTHFGYHPLKSLQIPPTGPWSSDGNIVPFVADIFPTMLPSTQMGLVPSFASCNAPATMMWLGVKSVVPDAASQLPPMPSEPLLRPYHTLRQLHTSIERGAWLTSKLFVPRETWLISSTRVQAIDTKIRLLELLVAGMNAVDLAGSYLLKHPDSQPPGLAAINTTRFIKQLEEFDVLCMDVQSSLSRKLGYIEVPSAVFPSSMGSGFSGTSSRKGGSGLGALSSKLSRGLDRMVAQSRGGSGTGSGADSPALYADLLSRVCLRATEVLGQHIVMLLGVDEKGNEACDGYSALSIDARTAAEARLRRASEFFTNVVLRFALRDVAILLDKVLKRSAAGLDD